MVKEFMRVQGAISSLATTLKDMAMNLDDQYDIFEILCRLLHQNEINHDEFKRMNGYDIFFKFIEQGILLAISDANVLLTVCVHFHFHHRQDNNRLIVGFL